MAPPLDLVAQFNRLVQLVSKDMKDAGNQIAQIVARVTQHDQRLAALEKRLGQAGMQPQQVVNGQVVPGSAPGATPEVPDATPLWQGNPDAFYQGGEND